MVTDKRVKKAIDAAIKRANGTGNLAAVLGVRPSTVSQWISGARPVPPIRAAQIEQWSGGKVSRRDLNPKFFDRLGA